MRLMLISPFLCILFSTMLLDIAQLLSEIKLPLKKRNRLMHIGRVAEAENLTNNIGERLPTSERTFSRKQM
jgi:hypothetical protein